MLLAFCLVVVVKGAGHYRFVELVARSRPVLGLHIVFGCIVQDCTNAMLLQQLQVGLKLLLCLT